MKHKNLLVLPASLILVSCSNISTEYDRINIDNKLVKIDNNAITNVEKNPLSFIRHFAIGLRYYLKSDRNNYDLQISRVAFETSWRLSRDFWPSAVYLALVFDKLGLHRQSLESFIEAANIYDHASLWRAASLSALKSGYERLSFELYIRSKTARIQVNDKINDYLLSSFDSKSAKDTNVKKEIKPISNKESLENNFECIAEDLSAPKERKNDDGENSDGSDGDSSKEKIAKYKNYDNKICNETNFYIQSYVITRNKTRKESTGVDLVSALQLTLGSTLYNFNRTATITDSVNSTTNTYSSSLSAVIPSITYALSISNENGALSSIDATPSFVMSLGQKSDLFDGSSFDVITSSSDSNSHFTKDLGIKLQAYIYRFDRENIGINFYTNISAPTDQKSFSNFQVFKNDKLENTNIFNMPINKAIVVASFSSDIIDNNVKGQTYIKDIPVLGKLFGVEAQTNSKRDVLIISFVRSDLKKHSSDTDERNLLSQYKFSSEKTIFRYGYIYNAPDIGSIEEVFAKNIKSFLTENGLTN